MRLQIVTLDSTSSTSFEQFLHFGKIGEGHRCRGKYKATYDGQIDRTNSIAATIFFQKDVVILYHWHTTPNGTRIEDETSHEKKDEYEKMDPTELFNTLLLMPHGRMRRICT